MSHSNHLTLSRIRDIFRILGEVRELGADPDAWRQHALTALCRLTDARVGVAAEIPLTREFGLRGVFGMVDTGWEDSKQRELFHAYMRSGVYQDPIHPTARRLAGKNWTKTREAIIEDSRWYGSLAVSELRRNTNVDDVMTSHHVTINANWTHVLSFNRDWGQDRFTDLHRKTLDLFHQELARLWRLNTPPETVHLTGRQREVLAYLRTGDSEKQIAQKLGLSRHTVHGHVRELHRRFGVNARGELLAQASRQPSAVRLTVTDEARLPMQH